MMLAPPRTDLSDAGLIEAIEADQLASRVEDPEIPVEVHRDPDVTWCVAPILDTYRSVVLAARFSGADADRRVADLMGAYADLGRSFVWWVAPSDSPMDLGPRLSRAGLALEGRAPAMAADIAALPLDEPGPPGLEIVPVADSATYTEFLSVVEQEWIESTGGRPTPQIRASIDAYARFVPPRIAEEPVPLRWLGRVDGRPVATARATIGAGVVGLYTVETLPPFRGRGFGRAMTLAAVRAAASLGYRIAVLQASELGYGVYRRLGYRELFTYEVYVHPSPER